MLCPLPMAFRRAVCGGFAGLKEIFSMQRVEDAMKDGMMRDKN